MTDGFDYRSKKYMYFTDGIQNRKTKAFSRKKLKQKANKTAILQDKFSIFSCF